MEAGARADNGFAIVALVLGITALIPLWGIGAAPFAIVFGLAGRRVAATGGGYGSLASTGLLLGFAGAIENALFIVFVSPF